MTFSIAASVGLVALLLCSVVNASSQYKGTRMNSISSSSSTGRHNIRQGKPSRSRRRRRNRTRSAVYPDDYKDEDYHRSLSSVPWEGASGHSSSPSLNDHWDIEESSYSSSFYDFEDLKPTSKKKKSSSVADETERILQSLERSSRQESDEDENKASRSKRSKRKKSRKRKNDGVYAASSLPAKSSKKNQRRRKRKITEEKPQGPVAPSTHRNSNADDPETIHRIKQRPMAKRAFVPRTPAASTGKPESASAKSTSNNVVRIAERSTGRKAPQPSLHPDRTTWEVPSYSHKISTMMNNKKNENNAKVPRGVGTTTALPRATPNLRPNNGIDRVASTARTVVVRATQSTHRTKEAAAPVASTPSSTTTPWVRKFLAARPKDRLLPLPRDYISDNFNLAQLPPIVERIGYQAMGDNAIPVAKALQKHRMATAASGAAQPPSRSTSYPIYRRALRSILADPSAAGTSEDDESSDEDLIIPQYAIQKAAEALYLLLHARFVISPRGLEAIRHVMALDNTVFGKCPRSCCKGTGLLPYGYSNDYTSDASVPAVTTASRKEHDSCCHRYCPSCGEVWISWESKTDGCAWGPSWCHLFLLAFGSQIYAKELEAAAAASQTPRPQSTTTPAAARSFLHRGIGARVATSTNISDRGSPTSEDLSRPTPSVFGFQIHPTTAFGRPFNEPSLRGGSNN